MLFGAEMDPSRKSGGALHRLHCFCLEFDGACEVQRRVPTDWIIEPIDVSGYGSFSGDVPISVEIRGAGVAG